MGNEAGRSVCVTIGRRKERERQGADQRNRWLVLEREGRGDLIHTDDFSHLPLPPSSASKDLSWDADPCGHTPVYVYQRSSFFLSSSLKNPRTRIGRVSQLWGLDERGTASKLSI